MGLLCRSEKMTLCQLFLPSEAAFDLGNLGLVQFQDINPEVKTYQRKFLNEIQRCEELERKLFLLKTEVKAAGLSVLDVGENPEVLSPKEIPGLESSTDELLCKLHEINQLRNTLNSNISELEEIKHSILQTKTFFNKFEKLIMTDPTYKELINYDGTAGEQHDLQSMQLGVVRGVIPSDRVPVFQRLLWRTYRGNVILHLTEIPTSLQDPVSGDWVSKSFFIVLFQNQLNHHIHKICEGFQIKLYPVPNTLNECEEVAMNVVNRKDDLKNILVQVEAERSRLLSSVAKQCKLSFIRVCKTKAIFHTLNLFKVDVSQMCLIGECWLAFRDMKSVQQALQLGIIRSNTNVPPILNSIDISNDQTPPTYNKTNKFTNAVQALIDAYGVAAYREVNPAPYTLITFPFLFAIMFGDFGHGLLIFLFAAWLILNEKTLGAKKSNNEIWKIMFAGRYVIFLLGLFSMYTGLIYNDVFSKSFNLLGSHWNMSLSSKDVTSNKFLQLDPNDSYIYTPYPVGLDPVWQVAGNKISFLNSFKMKISIIIGVLHMLFGLSLSVFNSIYFKKHSDIYTVFLPQIIFLLFLFFYLGLLIFIKWIVYGPNSSIESGPSCAPSVLITFINMVLFKTVEDHGNPCSPWMYMGQQVIERILVVAALLCIPWLFLAKPYLVMRKTKMDRGHSDITDIGVESILISPLEKSAQEDIAETWIHQSILTIEFVLGSISHTASYLRLWALSLAHAQLSEVLWNMVMRQGLMSQSMFGGVFLSVAFLFWALLTVGILVLMEGLSAFLHTLRLHWIEFQSKFYDGSGEPFIPFSFEVILNQASFEDQD